MHYVAPPSFCQFYTYRTESSYCFMKTNLLLFINLFLCVLPLEVASSYPGSVALDELRIKCGKCKQIKCLNRLRYHKHFAQSNDTNSTIIYIVLYILYNTTQYTVPYQAYHTIRNCSYHTINTFSFILWTHITSLDLYCIIIQHH